MTSTDSPTRTCARRPIPSTMRAFRRSRRSPPSPPRARMLGRPWRRVSWRVCPARMTISCAGSPKKSGWTPPCAGVPWPRSSPDARPRTIAASRGAISSRRGGSGPRVTIETERGPVVVELFPAEAPLTVAAFLLLLERRYFDGSTWHRVVPNLVVQDGDPRGDGWGGPGFALRDETNPMRYETGTVGMALSGPDTGGSQFFITHSPQPHLDGTYTVFGRVVSGLGALAAIGQG